MAFDYEYQGSPTKGQKGTFIGNPSATHIHLVGGNDHLKVQDKRRYNISWHKSADNQNKEKKTEIDILRRGWDDLVSCGDGSPGVPACKRWLRSYLIDYHGVNAAKLPMAGPTPPW